MANPFDENVNNFHFSGQTTPAIGASAELDALPNTLAEMMWFECLLTTDANAANRQVRFTINNGSIESTIAVMSSVIPASTSVHILFGQGLTPYAVTLGDRICVPLPSGIKILSAWHWWIRIDNIQVGDAIDDIRTYQRFWPYDQS